MFSLSLSLSSPLSRHAMEIPENTSEYLSADYWNERFKVEPKYEWLGEYSDNDMREKIHRHLECGGKGSSTTSADVVLVVGNGNSQMGQRVALDKKVTTSPSGCCITDISPVVVEKSREGAKAATGHQKHLRSTSWAVCDMLRLPFKDNSVDLIIEKGRHALIYGTNERLSILVWLFGWRRF